MKSPPRNAHPDIHREKQRPMEFPRRTDTDGTRRDATRCARDFVYVRSHDATRETKRIRSPLSEALAAKRRLNARDLYDATLASAPRVGRSSPLSLSLARQGWRRAVVEASLKVRVAAAKLAPVDAAEIETLTERSN